MKVLKSRSVDGLDPTLFEMDTICNTVTAFYHIIHKYPINTSVELYCWQSVACTIFQCSWNMDDARNALLAHKSWAFLDNTMSNAFNCLS